MKTVLARRRASPLPRQVHPHGVARSPDRARQGSYGQRFRRVRRLARAYSTLNFEQNSIDPRRVRNPPVNSGRANEARTSARSCGDHFSPPQAFVKRCSRRVEAIRLMISYTITQSLRVPDRRPTRNENSATPLARNAIGRLIAVDLSLEEIFRPL